MSERDSVTFYYNEHGTVSGRTRSGVYGQLASWLASDIQGYAPDCAWVIAMIHDVRSGKSSFEEWSGNSAIAEITPNGVDVRDIYPDNARRHHYSHDEAESVAIAYLRFIAPDTGARQRAVAAYEKEHGRRHPRRDLIA